MVSGGRRAGARTVVALAAAGALLTGCSLGDDDADASPQTSTSPDSSITAPPTDDGPTATPTPEVPSPPPNPGPGPLGVEITLPPAGVEATGPAVVVVHGGSWVGGDPELMDSWAKTLAASGAVVFNASYRLVYQGGGYPGSVDDLACAVRYARAEAPALTSSDQLVIMGHSAGGHLAAVVALNGDQFGGDCAYPPAALPDRFVGLGGVYDVRALGSLFNAFVGASAAEDPAAWTAVNPTELVDRRDDLSLVLISGADDRLIPPSSAEAFASLLPADRVTVDVVPSADHLDLLDPDFVGLERIRLGG